MTIESGAYEKGSMLFVYTNDCSLDKTISDDVTMYICQYGFESPRDSRNKGGKFNSWQVEGLQHFSLGSVCQRSIKT